MTQITGIIHFTFRPGQAGRFEELSRQAREIVLNNEPGTTRYDVFMAPDRSGAVVIEEYFDVAAAVAHQDSIGEELNRALVDTASDVHGELLGELPPELVAQLADSTARPYLTVFRTWRA